MPGAGWAPLGRRPIATLVQLPLPVTVAANALANGVVYTAEIYPVDGITPILRLATEEFATWDTDSTPNMPFFGALKTPLNFHRACIDASRLGGMASGYGEIVVSNPSGEFDSYANLLDAALIITKMGQRGASYDSFVTLCVSMAAGPAVIDKDDLILQIYDDNARLEIPAQPNVYGGTGGIDGDANVLGKRKPIWLGLCFNVSVPLIDATNLIYHLHDGPIYGISHVYDRGVEIPYIGNYADYAALVAANVPGGYYASCVALGIIMLGNKPDGIVTVSGYGAISNGRIANASAGTFFFDTANCVHYLLTISAANIVVDFGTVIRCGNLAPAGIGYWIGPDDNKSLRQAINELMNGILGIGSFRRDRTFELSLIRAPGTNAIADYTNQDFISLSQLTLPSGLSPTPWRVNAAYAYNFTIQKDIDATIDVSTVTLRKDQYSIATATNPAILAANPQAQDIAPWPCWFVSKTDAVAFCSLVLGLFTGTNLYEVVLMADGYNFNLNNTIRVTYNRYGLDAGIYMIIVSIQDNAAAGQVTVQGFV